MHTLDRSDSMAFDDFSVLLDAVHSSIRSQVAAGFADADTIIDTTLAMYEGEADPALLLPYVERYMRDILAVHMIEQANWPAVTDCDRLDSAFAALEAEGIICRQHFACCSSCGAAEIWDEIAAAEAAGWPAHGYAFYHMQDTDAAVDGRVLHISFGAIADGEAAAVGIAREVIAQLERHGLRTAWNSEWSQRIGLSIDWKRRRSG
jgi:hypothetical protein